MSPAVAARGVGRGRDVESGALPADVQASFALEDDGAGTHVDVLGREGHEALHLEEAGAQAQVCLRLEPGAVFQGQQAQQVAARVAGGSVRALLEGPRLRRRLQLNQRILLQDRLLKVTSPPRTNEVPSTVRLSGTCSVALRDTLRLTVVKSDPWRPIWARRVWDTCSSCPRAAASLATLWNRPALHHVGVTYDAKFKKREKRRIKLLRS